MTTSIFHEDYSGGHAVIVFDTFGSAIGGDISVEVSETVIDVVSGRASIESEDGCYELYVINTVDAKFDELGGTAISTSSDTDVHVEKHGKKSACKNAITFVRSDIPGE